MPYDVSRQAMTEYQNAFFAAARKKDQHLSDPELFDGSTLSLFVLWIGFTDDLTFIGILLSRITSLGHNLRPTATRAEKSDS